MAKCVQELHPRVVFSPKGGALALGHPRPVVACNPPCTIRNAAKWEYWGRAPAAPSPAISAEPPPAPPLAPAAQFLYNRRSLGSPRYTRHRHCYCLRLYPPMGRAGTRSERRLSLLPPSADIRPEVSGTWLVKPSQFRDGFKSFDHPNRISNRVWPGISVT